MSKKIIERLLTISFLGDSAVAAYFTARMVQHLLSAPVNIDSAAVTAGVAVFFTLIAIGTAVIFVTLSTK